MKTNGFTLIELMIVIAMLMILVSLFGPMFTKNCDDSTDNNCTQQTENVV